MPEHASAAARAPMPAARLAARYADVRSGTEALVAELPPEDMGLQSMADASPPKWHLAHTTWFFEAFVLARALGYAAFHPRYAYLFNSYYESVGRMHPRAQRGLLTRPTIDEVRSYRAHVDERILAALDRGDLDDATLAIVELGLHHEQQHQELVLTDLKHGFFANPLRPAYRAAGPRRSGRDASALRFLDHPGGVRAIGHHGAGFAFDNEGPRHDVLLAPFAIASRLVTCGEYLEFVRDGGYARAELWLSDGWDLVRREGWRAPLYWEEDEAGFAIFTLHGTRELDLAEPVCHVSAYEADAYARWSGHRLPTEAEWEVACAELPVRGNFVESGALHPIAPAAADVGIAQAFGDAWEWTGSAYAPYPGFRPLAGSLGEYNGKFMCNQLVLRGGSCATPGDHVRASYRNFFPPHARWQFSGVRLASDR